MACFSDRKNVFAALMAVVLIICLAFSGMFTAKIMGASGQLQPMPANSPFVPSGEPVEDHYFLCENENWKLYLKPETLSVLVMDKHTGEYMVSTVSEPCEQDLQAWKGFYQSGVVLEYIKGTNLNYTMADLVNTPNDIKLAVVEDGFWAEITYPELSISYRLVVTLDEYGVVAEIPQESIVEGDETFAVGCFYIFPFLGSVYEGSRDGYMFIPDGQGAIIELMDNEGRFTQPFSVPVYGSNIGIDDWSSSSMEFSYNESMEILMPVFGMVHSDTQMAFIGIIEEGDYFAKIEASPNGTLTLFDWVTAKFVYRQVYMQPTGQSSGGLLMRTERANNFDIKIRFDFVNGDQANYAGLAVRYREYLKEKGVFASADEEEFKVQVDFFGADKKNWALFKLNVNMTTFKQAGEIIETLKQDGVDGILSVYRGWQKGGVYGGLPTKGYTPAGNLGGKSELNNLFETAENNNAKIYLEHDPMVVNKETGLFESMNSIKRVTKKTFDIYWNGRVYDQAFLLTPERSLAISNNLAKSFEKNSVPGVALTNVTHMLTSYYYKGVYMDRGDNMKVYKELAEGLTNKILDRPYAYLWSEASAMYNLPIGGSSYTYTSSEIPFLSIVLSGQIPHYVEYTNFQANQKKFLLQLIESGAFPSFLVTHEDPFKLQETNSSDIYSSLFDLYRPKIVEMYNILKEVYGLTDGSPIIGHEMRGKLTRVIYENGTEIYLNYSEKPGSWDEHDLEGYGYQVVNKGREIGGEVE